MNDTNFMYDNRQISAIRFLPAKTIRNSKGEESVLNEKWKGIIKGINNEGDEFVFLEQEWMDRNVSEAFQEFVRSTRASGVDGYVRIPEGAPCAHDEKQVAGLKTENAPTLQFTQAKTWNDRSCVLKGAASCLWHLGEKRLANILCNNVQAHVDKGFEFFQSTMNPQKLVKREKRLFQFMELKANPLHWNYMEEAGKYYMVLAGLLSDDSKTDHAVAIAGNWIFDSNFKFALPLSKESLDLCCSDESRSNHFIGFTRICMLKYINK